ncbi:alpha/beta-hydrolase [Melanomma pulvis-pyrius CBS 109.77]|uniref:Alpha/beta-hydrolase n=1 Tax=Melanomma pulvis-pyrius CBS 109.77 TaxID=1314802 RepID=A0A6A6XER7_9PLEO|nr:alpha/beta-hydrolase [Melanomma pulvis-pyrius CBS 109.77]
MSPMAPEKVHFPSNGIDIVGELYLPASGSPSRKNAAIVIGHPSFGVKEQAAGAYARALSDAGFIALAFDAAYQGESGGLPRMLENPFQRAEDARAAVSYLTTRSEVDAERIGALGICASGGYVPFAAQTDTRMKAVATVSGADFGRIVREGLKPKGSITREQLMEQLAQANALRTIEAKDGEARMVVMTPQEKSAIPEGAPDLIKDAWDYYMTDRGRHPRSRQSWVGRSMDLCANFDAYRFVDMISPRPLLMIAGEKADTKYFSEEAIQQAKEPKELFVVEGKSHVALYDDLSETAPKLLDFFAKSLVEEKSRL